MRPSRRIAVIGGTGPEGGGLALRLAAAGHQVVIGSRDAARAVAAAAAAAAAAAVLGSRAGVTIGGAENAVAARAAEIVILTVPYGAQRATVETLLPHIAGKILIDATVPLMPPKVGRVQLPDGASAVAAIQALVGDKVRVVSAFQNVSAHHLAELGHPVDCDVLVCGDDRAACDLVIGLIDDMGMRGIHAGPVQNSAATEALTSLLIAINRRYKVLGAGIRITGLADQDDETRSGGDAV